MKRILCVLLILSMAAFSGCGRRDANTVSFYYCRNPENYQYFEENGVIQAESREITGHRSDLRYVVGLYLAGPLEEELESPFSKTTRLVSAQKSGETIQIQLSDQDQSLSDASFSLACACLTLTCMNIFSCTEVTVTSGERTVTMNEGSIMLFDTLLPQEATGG